MFNLTKTIALAVVTTVGAAGYASAATDAYFGVQNTVDSGDEITLEYIHAPADGTVEIFAYTGDTVGELLGTGSVDAGGNINKTIDVGLNTADKVLAVLTVDGAPVVTETLYVK
ncbi:hypothetical protein BVC71_09780 [Marivivens niveibacter]|uniref:Uncharacterized protein n=1 Tax=Marivivens niveibacter TaxID=1930667 RepID=A0A251WXZ5_9RHOB|nr:hypothetical protein [Marivivens niveibacter]OUD08995.1 hypothetical protein BVC71_09780 [Marivivens niveibacter]